PPSRTLYVGLAGHPASIAVASVANDHDAAGLSLGPWGTRPGALAPLLRQRPSQANPLVFVSAAGPWGAWLSRSLTPQDALCGVGAPAFMPHKAGARGPTARRDALPLARRMRSGDRPPGSGPA